MQQLDIFWKFLGKRLWWRPFLVKFKFLKMDSVTGVFLSVFETPFYGCFHCVKSVQYRVFSGPYFHVFELTTERYSISLRIQSEYGKIRTRKNSVFGHFLRSVPNIEHKRIPLNDDIVQILAIKDLSKSRSFFLLNLLKYLGTELFYSFYA